MFNALRDTLPWLPAAGRLVWASLIALIGLGVAFALIKRPKSDKPATWAQCMGGAVAVMALMFLCYAVIPSEWIIFANARLDWSTDRFFIQTYPIKVPMSAIRDIVATGIYLFFFGLNLLMWSLWQQRKPASEVEAAEPTTDTGPTRRSRFGRPLRRA